MENRLPVGDSFCLFTLPARVRLQYIKFLNPDWPDLLLFNRCCAFLTDKFEFYVLKKVIRVDEQFIDQFIF